MSWEVKRLGDVIEIRNGKNQHEFLSETGEYPILGSAGNVMGYSTEYLCEAGTTIIGRKGNISKPIFINQRFWNVDTAFGLYPKSLCEVDRRFVYYLSLNIDFASMNRGTTIPSLVKSELQAIEIKVPSISEQETLVDILDETFASIDKAKEATEKNLRNAQELFEGYLESAFANGGEGWNQIRLGALCDKLTDGTHFSPKNSDQGDYMYITAKNIKPYRIDKRKISYITAEDHREIYARCPVRKGDVLYIKDGATAGIGAINDIEEEFSLLSSVALIRPGDKLLNTFLVHYMNSAIGRKNFLGYIDGAAITRLTLIKLKSVFIPVPSISIQHTIVKNIDALLDSIKKLEAIYTQKLAALEELKKSILQKAFAGELTKVSESGFTGLEDVQDAASVGKVPATLDIPIRTRVIEMPLNVPNIAATDLQAGITAYAFKKHFQAGQENTFHHVKAEKIAHLVESHVFIELGRTPMKNVAGPNDYPHAKKVESRAAKAGFYTVRKDGDHYVYTMGKKSDELVEKVKDRLGEKFESVTRLIDLMLPLNTRQSEIVATVYAGWNNLLSDGVEISDEAIVYESRENWTESKLNIPREDFFKWLEWMRKNELVPRGVGKKVLHKTAKK